VSLLSVVCCQVEVSATGWSLVQRSPTECGVSKSMIVKPRKMRRPMPPRGCGAIGKNNLGIHSFRNCRIICKIFAGHVLASVSVLTESAFHLCKVYCKQLLTAVPCSARNTPHYCMPLLWSSWVDSTFKTSM
jgi:hypothetical protein